MLMLLKLFVGFQQYRFQNGFNRYWKLFSETVKHLELLHIKTNYFFSVFYLSNMMIKKPIGLFILVGIAGISWVSIDGREKF